MKTIQLALAAGVLLAVSAAAQRPAPVAPADPPPGRIAVQPAPDAALPDDAVLRARVAKIAAARRKSLREDQKAAGAFFATYEKRRLKAMPPVNMPEYLAADAMSAAAAQVSGPFNAEERLFIQFQDTRTPVRDLIPTLIREAVAVQRAIAAVPDRERALERAAATPRSRVAGLLPDYKEALAREQYALRQQMITLNGVLAALEQGGPADYEKRYETMIAEAREKARAYQARLDAQQEAFARAIGGGLITGIVGFSLLAAATGKDLVCTTEQMAAHNSEEISRRTACGTLPNPGVYSTGVCPFVGYCMRMP